MFFRAAVVGRKDYNNNIFERQINNKSTRLLLFCVVFFSLPLARLVGGGPRAAPPGP